MIHKTYKWLNRKYPQNFIIAKPYLGYLIIMVFCLAFTLLYKPLNFHPGKFLSFEQTMLVYCIISPIPIILLSWLIKKIRFFSDKEKWTIIKEFISSIIIFLGIGTTVYFIAFIVEEPGDRWHLETFGDSCLKSFLVCFIPFAYFTLKNYRYLLSDKKNMTGIGETDNLKPNSIEKLININSRLKKEELSFYPSQFLYAISDGNYVNFFLNDNSQIKKETIRYSISNIEEQLSEIPYLFRTHRAFIINMKKVTKKKGNSLGYKLAVEGVTEQIPVSRQKISLFDKLFKEYK